MKNASRDRVALEARLGPERLAQSEQQTIARKARPTVPGEQAVDDRDVALGRGNSRRYCQRRIVDLRTQSIELDAGVSGQRRPTRGRSCRPTRDERGERHGETELPPAKEHGAR